MEGTPDSCSVLCSPGGLWLTGSRTRVMLRARPHPAGARARKRLEQTWHLTSQRWMWHAWWPETHKSFLWHVPKFWSSRLWDGKDFTTKQKTLKIREELLGVSQCWGAKIWVQDSKGVSTRLSHETLVGVSSRGWATQPTLLSPHLVLKMHHPNPWMQLKPCHEEKL